jgi:hypothetical protein
LRFPSDNICRGAGRRERSWRIAAHFRRRWSFEIWTDGAASQEKGEEKSPKAEGRRPKEIRLANSQLGYASTKRSEGKAKKWGQKYSPSFFASILLPSVLKIESILREI